jgi:hypothetical protein
MHVREEPSLEDFPYEVRDTRWFLDETTFVVGVKTVSNAKDWCIQYSGEHPGVDWRSFWRTISHTKEGTNGSRKILIRVYRFNDRNMAIQFKLIFG